MVRKFLKDKMIMNEKEFQELIKELNSIKHILMDRTRRDFK
jgi:hypothetical protein